MLPSGAYKGKQRAEGFVIFMDAERIVILALYQDFLITSVLALQLTLWKPPFYKDKILPGMSPSMHGRGLGTRDRGRGGEKNK